MACSAAEADRPITLMLPSSGKLSMPVSLMRASMLRSGFW
jgi:hypothetical protein